jgi:hypothetical protein
LTLTGTFTVQKLRHKFGENKNIGFDDAKPLPQADAGEMFSIARRLTSIGDVRPHIYGSGPDQILLDSPKAEWLWEHAQDQDVLVHIHPPWYR